MRCRLESEIKEMRCRLESEIKEMRCRLESEIKEMRDRSDACESKMVRGMLCFTKEKGAGGCESRGYQTAGVGCGRLCLHYVRACSFGSVL